MILGSCRRYQSKRTFEWAHGLDLASASWTAEGFQVCSEKPLKTVPWDAESTSRASAAGAFLLGVKVWGLEAVPHLGGDWFRSAPVAAADLTQLADTFVIGCFQQTPTLVRNPKAVERKGEAVATTYRPDLDEAAFHRVPIVRARSV